MWTDRVPDSIKHSRDRGEVEKKSREAARSTYLGGSSILTRCLGRYNIFADTLDDSIMPHLALDGFWEMWTTLAIARLTAPGATCLDVGACFGYYSALMGDIVGPTGLVYAFEPNPPTFAHLTRTASQAHCKNIVCRPWACGSSREVRKLRYNPHQAGMASMVIDNGGQHAHEVPVCRLDDLDIRTPVGVLKIDAEGMDYEVIQGARRILKESPRVFIFSEHCGTAYGEKESRKLLGEVEALGFTLNMVDHTGDIHGISKGAVAENTEAVWNLCWWRGA